MQQKKKARPLFAALLAAVLILALLPLPAYATDDYTLENGVLTIHTNAGTSTWQAAVNHAAVTTLVLEDNVTEIQIGVFANFVALQSVTISPNVKKIGEGAFYGCIKLESVTLPGGLEEIGSAAFQNCPSLASVTLPDSLVKIGDDAFASCTSLTSVTLPDSLTEIGAGAFRVCSTLQSLTIPPKVTSIREQAFKNCSMLTTLTFQGQTAPTLGDNVFNGATSLTTINVPYGATGYDQGTWLTNTGLVTLNIKYADPPAPPTPAAPAPEAEGVPHVCYFGVWQYSNEHHWKRCSCMALSDYAPHVFNSARVCTVCGYGATAKKANPPTGVYNAA